MVRLQGRRYNLRSVAICALTVTSASEEVAPQHVAPSNVRKGPFTAPHSITVRCLVELFSAPLRLHCVFQVLTLPYG
jgi:hypothetical protein